MAYRFVIEPRPALTSPRRLFADKLAKWIVTAGGLGIIASILGILVFLLIETLPLARSAEVGSWRVMALASGEPILGVTCDAYQTHFAAIDLDGRVRVGRIQDGTIVQQKDIFAGLDERPRVAGVTEAPAGRGFVLATMAGSVFVQPVAWRVSFRDAERQIEPALGDTVALDLGGGKPLAAFAATIDEDGATSVAAQTKGGRLVWIKHTWEVNDFTGEKEARVDGPQELPFSGTISSLLIHQSHTELFAATENNRLLWWRNLRDEPLVVPTTEGPVSAMGFLFGERALVLGTAGGGLSVWFPARPTEGADFELIRARGFEPLGGPITSIAPSQRNKGFLAAAANGDVAFYYSTTGNRDWLAPSLGSVGAIAIAPKMDGFLVGRDDQVLIASVEHPHPEATLTSLFSKVLYEGFQEPTHTWQSTGGSDDFEPKLGLVPLIFGTLKGTIFALLMSVPLAVLGAMFVSQFLHHDLRKYVKPAIEIMAAMPSVILGFIAALWLAPLLEVGFCAFMLMPLVMPVFVVLAGWSWMQLPTSFRARFPVGSEALLFVGALVLAIWICVLLNRPMEVALFDGDFPAWVTRTLDLSYEQKNSVVIAIAMSFAVIPIIFTISEDAFSNVPRSLVAGSLALGANRWQTVTRVVLPTASPGIFSATMVGFGRAVGETMIVLMATGNTPILEWNPFNGFRTLSANIAVEIPEAPEGGTLYRTLFLAALILFVMTFLINTVAESVRQRLRSRYASL